MNQFYLYGRTVVIDVKCNDVNNFVVISNKSIMQF